MLTTCPACGARASLEILIQDDVARDCIATALTGAGELGALIVRYLALFRPARRALTWDRVGAILGEIMPAIAAAKIERRGRTWAAPREAWIGALTQMLANRERLQLPLKSNGYLYEIMIASADQAEGRAEARRESERQHAAASRGKAEQTPMPEAVREKLARYASHYPTARLDIEEGADGGHA